MKRQDRDIEVFSLSFLDCICCGFGAIILLLVLSEYGQPIVLEKSRKNLEGQVLELTQQVNEISGTSDVLNRELQGRVETLEHEKLKLAKLSGDLSNIHGLFASSRTDAAVTNIVETELVSAQQTLTVEMQRLLKSQADRPKREVVGGIPIDSEYIIFVQDTSGSMDAKWRLAVAVMGEILDLYPRVKGLQIMNDQGRYMMEGSRGSWLTDSPALRKQIVLRMRTWRPFSQSNPVPGILEALSTYKRVPEKRISIYVLGDEFTGDSVQAALNEIRRLNKPAANGRRLVRVHAVGYLNDPRFPPFTNIRFATLMRSVCNENDGTFVALTRN